MKNYIVGENQNNEYFSKFIEFNPDEISTHHKNYPEIIRDYPDYSHTILQRFTRRALDDYLRQRAVDMRCNIMQEGTFGSTQGYINIINFQKNGGYAEIGKLKTDGTRELKKVKGDYNVEINVLAVNKYESLLSCFEREQYFDENGLPPRAVTIENHNNSYEKMLETIDIVEKERLYDKMRVFRRGYVEERPELIFIAGDKRFSSTVDAVRREREKQEKELFRNPAEYLKRIGALKVKAEKYKNNSLIARLDCLENMFCKQLEEYRDEKTIG